MERPRSDELSIIVPTVRSEKYLDLILDYYENYAVEVVVFVDSKSSERVREIVAQRNFRSINVHNDSTRVGEIIELISHSVSGKWILRIDDDELPSGSLMNFVYEAVRRDEADVYGLIRHQCTVANDGKLLRSNSVSAHSHRQWRLYKRETVIYRTDGHTPGFYLENLNAVPAPDEACLIHLDWALHSYEERRSKVEAYDIHTPGHGEIFRDYYLPEESGESIPNLRRLYLEEFDTLARQIAERKILEYPDHYFL